MNKVVGSLVIIALLLFSSCSRDTITSPQLNKTSGTVSLKFDKINAPQNVVNIIAYLSRAGYDTLKGNLNLLSDSSADILIQNIPAGQWHLTIDALNDSSEVVYSGETDVLITDGLTTQVSLSLVPTGQGKGNVYISVNWGTQQALWVDYYNNPVFTVYQNPSHPNAISEVKIISDNGIYKMWYLCTYNAGRGNVWYAESMDGINWVNKSVGPVLDVDSLGTWDDHAISGGAVLKDGNIYKMYFNGLSENYGQSSTGLAVSNDGIHWVRYPNPVIQADNSLQYHIGTVSVVKVGSDYYLYYNSSPISNYNQWTINLATSKDGYIWTKYEGNPILTPTYSWEGIGITYPSVIYDNNQFIMIYESTDRQYYGMAYSNDGIHWTKRSQKPVFSVANTNIQGSTIDYPCLVKIGNEYRIYYSGSYGTDQLHISFARSYSIQ
ncbi:MAG: hypothetical protein M1480_15080 [Bacteroidetes bacterium]|nr:hypothetical protein [Bacteroidota bacterium]